MTSIPVIDVAKAFAGRDIEATVSAIDAALREFGFFQMVGHGIEPEVFTAAYNQVEDLIENQPQAVRDQLRNTTGHPFYGLVPKPEPGGNRVVAEQFEINRFENPQAALAAGVAPEHLSHFGTNLWPGEEMPDFRPQVAECFRRTNAVVDPLLELLAIALGQPTDLFTDYMDKASTSFAVSRYPFNDFLDPGSTVLEWHTDRETLVNLLHQRGSYNGLQLKVPHSREVIDVPIVPEALVVNVGQLIAMWTSNRWPAVVHRVVSSGPDDWRQSIVTFTAPDIGAEITPISADGLSTGSGKSFRVFDLAADLPRQDATA